MREKSVLILGVGNVLLSDEGIGVHVARRLVERDLPPDVEVVDGGTGGYELIEFFLDKKRAIIVDCLQADEPAGAVIRASPEELGLRWPRTFSSHQGGLQELLERVRFLPRPPEITIVGIVPERIDAVDMHLSKTLQAKIDGIVQKVLETATAH